MKTTTSPSSFGESPRAWTKALFHPGQSNSKAAGPILYRCNGRPSPRKKAPAAPPRPTVGRSTPLVPPIPPRQSYHRKPTPAAVPRRALLAMPKNQQRPVAGVSAWRPPKRSGTPPASRPPLRTPETRLETEPPYGLSYATSPSRGFSQRSPWCNPSAYAPSTA